MTDPIEIPPSDGPLAGGKQVSVLLGPYAGQVLVMPEAEATQAEADHWAVVLPRATFDPNEPPAHSNLTPEERAAAEEAAATWAATARGEPLPEPGEGEVPETRTRDLQPDESAGYQTRRGPGRPPTRR